LRETGQKGQKMMKQIKLGTTILTKSSISHLLIMIALIAVLLLPILMSWIYLNSLYTNMEISCDQRFWQTTIDSKFTFPFIFFGEMLLTNPGMWIVLFLGIGFTSFGFIQALHLVRMRDFPAGLVWGFVLLSIASLAVFWYSIDLFAKSKIEEKLTDETYRSRLLDRNLENLGNALANQVATSLTIPEIKKAASKVRFADSRLYDRLGVQAGALFDKTGSELALFQACKEDIGLKVQYVGPDGFTVSKDVSVNVIMPIEYQNIVQGLSWKQFDYFVDVFKVHYLFSWFWWVYYFLIMIPVVVFFVGFILYSTGIFKIK